MAGRSSWDTQQAYPVLVYAKQHDSPVKRTSTIPTAASVPTSMSTTPKESVPAHGVLAPGDSTPPDDRTSKPLLPKVTLVNSPGP